MSVMYLIKHCVAGYDWTLITLRWSINWISFLGGIDIIISSCDGLTAFYDIRTTHCSICATIMHLSQQFFNVVNYNLYKDDGIYMYQSLAFILCFYFYHVENRKLVKFRNPAAVVNN